LCAWFIRYKFLMYLVWLATISPPCKWQHCTHILYEPEYGTCLLFCTHRINQWLCATYCIRHFPSFTGLTYILHYCVLSLTNCEIFSPVTCLNFMHIIAYHRSSGMHQFVPHSGYISIGYKVYIITGCNFELKSR
jgi:hypothetical protein